MIGTINGVVDGISANKFTGDGFIISSPVIRNDDGSPNYNSHYGRVNFSKNLIVRNSTFDDNRRNGLALTDVQGALIEDNIFSNTGLGGEYSYINEGYSWKGYTPRFGIDLEAINYLKDDGVTLRLTEIVEDVVIRNNIFDNNYHGDIDFYKSWDVDVYGNTFGNGVGNVASHHIKIHDNIFEGTADKLQRAVNIVPKIRQNGIHWTTDWEIYNNEIYGGYNNGIIAGGENHKIYNNNISNTIEGITVLNGINNLFKDNDIESNKPNSLGYRNFALGGDQFGLEISGGEIDVVGYPLDFNKMNQNNGGNIVNINNIN